jgi:hypothetical protein
VLNVGVLVVNQFFNFFGISVTLRGLGLHSIVHIQYRTILQYKPFTGNLILLLAFLDIMLKSAKKTSFKYYSCLIFVGYPGIANI